MMGKVIKRKTLVWSLVIIATVIAIRIRARFIATSLSNYSANPDEILTFLQAKAIAHGELSLFFWTQPYQFPIEAYIFSAFYSLLPWTTLGLRVIPLTICLTSVLGFLLVLRFLLPKDKRRGQTWLVHTWPGVALILFPSAYVFLRQVGIMTPQHAMSTTFAWLLPLIFGLGTNSRRPHLWSLFAGLMAGLALSNHLLLLSVAAVCGLGHCLGRNPREALRNTSYYFPGFILGALPYFYAKIFIPGAYQKVADTVPLTKVFSRILDPVLLEQVPIALGVNVWIFPDAGRRLTSFAWLSKPLAISFLLVLILSTVLCLHKLWLRSRQERWISITLADIFTVSTWIALVLVALSAMEVRTRYLLPLAWCFPFLITFIYVEAKKATRVPIAAFVLLLAFVNVATIRELNRTWSEPGFSTRYANLPGLEPVYSYLESKHATRCYAGWWLAYRIIFETKESIICSPPYNDRFPGWPQPYYRGIVDSDYNTPYIEGVYLHRLLRGPWFIPYLLHHRIKAERTTVGPFTFYSDFQHQDIKRSSVLPSNLLSVRVSHNPEEGRYLVDGDLETVWSSKDVQNESMWIELQLEEARLIHTVRLLTTYSVYQEEPPRLQIEAMDSGGEWKTVIKDSVGHPYVMKLDPDFPRYTFDKMQLSLGFRPIETRKIRIAIKSAREFRQWEIADIHVSTGDLR